jgi:hypothetical protein
VLNSIGDIHTVKIGTKPADSNKIIIDKPLVKGRNLVFKLGFSKNLNQYLLSDHLEFQYDIDISEVSPSILYIPAVASLVCVAWAVGADIVVHDIDETYLNSLNEIKKVFVNWFTRFSFSTQILTEKTTNNSFHTNRDAILYTGGLDSLTSLLRNKDQRPTMICIWGASHPFPENSNPKKKREWETNFQNQFFNEFKICCVYTNAGNIINEKLLVDRYLKEDIHSDDWWETVSHGLTLTGLSAPITAVERTANLLMASSHFNEPNLPHGSSVFSLVNMKWANTQVIYDSGDLSRQDKIRDIFKGNIQYYGYLHVCNNIRSKKQNCSHCEKCFRTIIGLIMEGIDPNDCNFSVHNGILDYIKICLQKGWIHFGYDQIGVWQDIQDHVATKCRIYNADTFFTWFRNFRFSEYEFKGNGIGQLIQQYFYLAKYDLALASKLAVKLIIYRLQLITIWRKKSQVLRDNQ